jgi:hypothetical protein
MSAKGLLLLGALGAGAAFLFLHSASANAAVFPPGWVPPAGSTSVVLPANPNLGGLSLKKTTWTQAADAGGAQAGTYTLLQNAANPANDWAVLFTNTGSNSVAVMAVGTTQNSGLLAQYAVSGQ